MSRKDQTNKKKLSPLTNHKNTKVGIIKGGFDRVNLFQQAEQGFDKLFNYNRQQVESFDYLNTIKNSSMSEQLKLQEQEFQSNERKIEINQDRNQENVLSINLESKEESIQFINTDTHIATKQESNVSISPSFKQKNDRTYGLFLSFPSLGENFLRDSNSSEEQMQKLKKGKKKDHRL